MSDVAQRGRQEQSASYQVGSLNSSAAGESVEGDKVATNCTGSDVTVGLESYQGEGVECDNSVVTRLLLMHQVSTICTSLLTMQPRTELLARACNGDTSVVARQINRGAALVALSDFIVSPTFGALSDRIGRRPCMLIGPAVALPLKFLAALRPTTFVLFAERVVCDALRTMTGTMMSYTCLADLCGGAKYTQALARISSATGIGIVIAPLVSAFCARLGSPRVAYILSGFLAALHLFVGVHCLPETLVVKTRHACSGESTVRPMTDFLRLFTSGARLRVCSCLFTLHSMIEGKILQDQVSILQLGAGWSAETRSQWTAGMGLAILSGSELARPLLAYLGEHTFTSLAHAASLAVFLSLRQQAFWGALLMMCIGQQRRHTAASWVINEARAAGMGRGEVTGYLASLRAAMDFFVSMLFSRAHSFVAKRGQPSDIMLLPCCVVVVAELVHLRVRIERRKSS